MKRLIAIFAAMLLSASACDSSKKSGAEAPTSEPTEHVEHAPQGYEPGSHEDWCGEHQVPESMCTRCNAKLIPAFKASGDWCEEHELPKSQDLACNPDLEIERPPKVEGS